MCARHNPEPALFDDGVIDAAAIAHILDGHDEYRGGHRFDSHIVGKTVFPESWSDEQIIWAVKAVVRRPDYVKRSPPFLYIRALILDVVIEVALRSRKSRYTFEHAFPKSGVGIFRNEARRRIELPLDLNDLEE